MRRTAILPSFRRSVITSCINATRPKQPLRQPRLISCQHRSCYSTESSTTAAHQEDVPPTTNPSQATATTTRSGDTPPSTEKPEIREDPKDKEIASLKDKYLRLLAEMKNAQSQNTRDMDAAKKFAVQRLAKDLLDSIDNFDRALKMVPNEVLEKKEENKDLVDLHSGLKMTEEILLRTLSKHGLVKVDPTGKKFDPSTMEATFEAPVPGEPGTVFHVEQLGFTLNDRVIRPAKVGIVRGAAD